MYNYKHTLHTSKKTLMNFTLYFCSFNVFLIHTSIFYFDKLHFLLTVEDMLEQNIFAIPGRDSCLHNQTKYLLIGDKLLSEMHCL